MFKDTVKYSDVEHLNFSHSNYDPLSKCDSLIVYSGKLKDGRSVDIEIVYPSRAQTNFYLRIEGRDFLHGLNREMKRFTKKKSMSDFIQFKMAEYVEESENPKKKKRKKKKRRK